jgi:EAL domain-containing protein (putative c-di-GMP-specific phosphodiesterase class I)
VRPSLPYPSRTSLKIVAAAFGILMAGTPIILFNAWLNKQGDDEIAITSAWALDSSELRLGQAIAALQDLAARGIDSCRPGHVEVMHQTAILTGPIKQVMLLAANGEVLCPDTGGIAARHELLTSIAAADPGIVLEVVRLTGPGERFLRIRKAGKPNKPSLAALVPASLLLARAPTQGRRLPGYVRIAMTDGTPVGDSGVTPGPVAQEEQFVNTLRSKQYPLVISVSMPGTGVIANHEDLRRIGMVMTGGIALVILLFALLFSKLDAIDPMADMAKAIRDDEFVPYYQPLVDLQNGRLIGAEVLVRWRQPDGTFVEPNAFVLLLESSGLVLEFTRKLMRLVREELGDAVGRRPNMSIAFNVAPRHFDDALILNDVGTIFDGSPIKLSQVVLEVTERHEVVNLTDMRRTIAALQRVGCKVAIDDVGTGHSGLSYILKLGVDIIKIDKIFVEAIGSEGPSKAIIETLIDLARNMRMEIIAEGVETFDQVTYLRERGIGAAQGYVFAPPLPAATFLQLLEAMDPVAGVAGPPPRETSQIHRRPLAGGASV